MVVENFVLYIRPEFIEGVAAESSEESQADSNCGAARVVFAGGAPGVRNKVASGNGYKTRIGRHYSALAILRHECHLGGVAQPIQEGRARVAAVTRVFAPDSAQAGFHAIAQCQTAEPHTIAIPEAFPVRPVRVRMIKQRAPSGAEETGG